MQPFTEPISELIWKMKYQYELKGQVIDHSIEETWLRVAQSIACAEKKQNRQYWAKQFYGILEKFQFLPGGRILAGSGTKHKVTLFNCFVMRIAKDSLPSIFSALKEGAITLQQGGGVGYDFSVLRPYGDLAKSIGFPASGPVSFMRIWDVTCGILLSTGARRGAMMGILRCDHPDIEAFIEAKSDPKELRNFNISVMVTDQFMQAVKNDEAWPLIFPVYSGKPKVYRYLKARTLWKKIIHAAYEYAEPGVLFYDTINRLNNLWYKENIQATNPCGEIPLPSYGACDLGAINLTQFILDPFTQKAKINWPTLLKTAEIATRFLDNVIDVSRYPLNEQCQQALLTRRIGLGITGLADALLMLNHHYQNDAALTVAKDIMRQIAEVTWQTSIELAKEKGHFPFYTKDYLKGEYVSTLPRQIFQSLKRYGVRNSHHNTIAPTGTISLLANNISNGIEPIFSPQYERNVRMENGEIKKFIVSDYAFKLWAKDHKGVPKAFTQASQLPPDAHLAMQAALQPFVDNAISKTINLPADYPLEKLEDLYTKAYWMGLKGCTIFRPNNVTGHVLIECCHFEEE